MLLLTLSALIVGAAHANEALPWPDGSAEKLVYMAFLPRHPTQSCDEVTADLSAPAATLDTVVHGPSLPPWVPMRAATCLVDQHLQDGEKAITGWLEDPKMLGLARLVMRRLADMPAPIAKRLETAALRGPHQSVFSPAAPSKSP
jgi:hypothetical protein